MIRPHRSTSRQAVRILHRPHIILCGWQSGRALVVSPGDAIPGTGLCILTHGKVRCNTEEGEALRSFEGTIQIFKYNTYDTRTVVLLRPRLPSKSTSPSCVQGLLCLAVTMRW